jgi:phosphoribosylaminoimidazole-succinocarboxamide synthase
LVEPSRPGLPGWNHVYSGKVRDIYAAAPGSPWPDALLLVASDRISAYDYVLPTPIPDKGRVLTQLSLWWFDQLSEIVPNHVLSLDVPAAVEGRAMICRKLTMFPVECVARGYLTGSGLKEYRADGTVCGLELPPGLVDGARLDQPIFTPATKADLGEHDENVSYEVVAAQLGEPEAARLRRTTIALYARAEQIARQRGIVLADTKFEFGLTEPSKTLNLGDEVLTPDSSRFWDLDSWRPGRPQPSFDKQFVRDWLVKESGWDRTTPPPELPEAIVAKTRDRYLEAFARLTGHRLP